MKIRTYHSEDRSEVMELFDLNCPLYFSPVERTDLEKYLDSEQEDYFVVEMDHQLAACGGINLQKEGRKGVLSWDMVRPDYQNHGIGKALVDFRIRHLKEVYHVTEIGVRTAQFTHVFYTKCGFEVQEIIVDYWAPGYDLYDMVYISTQ